MFDALEFLDSVFQMLFLPLEASFFILEVPVRALELDFVGLEGVVFLLKVGVLMLEGLLFLLKFIQLVLEEFLFTTETTDSKFINVLPSRWRGSTILYDQTK